MGRRRKGLGGCGCCGSVCCCACETLIWSVTIKRYNLFTDALIDEFDADYTQTKIVDPDPCRWDFDPDPFDGSGYITFDAPVEQDLVFTDGIYGPVIFCISDAWHWNPWHFWYSTSGLTIGPNGGQEVLETSCSPFELIFRDTYEFGGWRIVVTTSITCGDT